jgi:hypothetical protein
VGVQVDIIHDFDRQHVIYEVKNREIEPLDVYQLVMYWDACVRDGHRPTLARLVSSEEPPAWLDEMIDYWNRRKDASGRRYRIEFKQASEFIGGYPTQVIRSIRARRSPSGRRPRRCESKS